MWDCAFGSGALQLEAAGDVLYGLIKVATSAKEWAEVSRSLYDPVAIIRSRCAIPLSKRGRSAAPYSVRRP